MIVVLASIACGHAAPRALPAPRIVWPEPPAAARVRLSTTLPDPSAPRPRPSLWRRALGLLTGAERNEPDGAALSRPFGIALADDGSVVVTDPDAARVVRFSPEHVSEDLECPGRPWVAPMAVAIAPGAIYVADAGAAAVVRWTPGGCTAWGASVLERPTGIAIQRARVWVVDPPRHQVVAFSEDGTVVARVGEHGDGISRFNYPSALTATADGLLIVDALNFRIVRLDPEGRWVGTFGEAGEGQGAFLLPKAVAAHPDGRVYVSDARRDEVLVFAPNGRFEYSIGATGPEAGRFTHPAGIAVTADRIAVADSHNHRVELFEFLGDPP